MTRYGQLFGDTKPVIAMVHIKATPGTPLYDEARGLEGMVTDARADLRALQAAGFDAVMFGNEHDRPYELQVDVAATATMAYVIGRLHDEITRPLRCQRAVGPTLHDGPRGRHGRAIRARDLHRDLRLGHGPLEPRRGSRRSATPDASVSRDVVKLYNVSAEFAYSLDGRSLPDRARSAVVSSVPDAVLVSGAITGEAAAMSDLEAVKRVLPTTPVLANTGVRHETVADTLAVADGVIVGSALKFGGDTWAAVDPDRARDFMDRVRGPGTERDRTWSA